MTLRQAAEFTGRTPEQVRELIDTGDIKGRIMPNTGGMMISREELIVFLKSCREWTKFKKTVQPKVIIVEPDSDKGLMMKADLERGSGLKVRVVSGVRDLQRETDKGGSDLIAVHLLQEEPLDSDLCAILQKTKQESDAILLVYHRFGDDLLEKKPDIKSQFESLPIDFCTTYLSRLAPVIESIRAAFGDDHASS